MRLDSVHLRLFLADVFFAFGIINALSDSSLGKGLVFDRVSMNIRNEHNTGDLAALHTTCPISFGLSHTFTPFVSSPINCRLVLVRHIITFP